LTETSSFSPIPLRPRPSVVWDIAGPTMTGRTDFLCHAPGPIAYVDIDGNAEDTVRKHQLDAQGRARIYYAAYEREMPAGIFATLQGADTEKALHEQTRNASLPLMLKLMRDVKGAAESGKFRTICIDTQDEIWQTIRLAHFGRLAKVPGHLYDKANADFRYFISTVKAAGVNLLMASKVEDEWVNKTDERTGEEKRVQSGRKKRSGTDKVDWLVGAYFESRRIDRKGQMPKFELELKKCTRAPHCVGMVWSSCNEQGVNEIVFADIASMLNPDIDPAVWHDRLEAA
jgi:hypothetical protein